MKFLSIIQARMGSKRFPKKVLYKFKNKFVLDHLIDSILQCIDKSIVVVATSTNAEDNAIYEHCSNRGIECFRGDPENVANRFYKIISDKKIDFFIRLNADSPLFDYRIIKKMIHKYKWSNADIISTVPGRLFPSGMNAELLKREIFIDAYSKFSHPDHFEHVTKYFYDNSQYFKIYTLKRKIKDSHLYKFSFDTEEDKTKIEKIFNSFKKEHYFYNLKYKCKIYKKLFLMK